ncbi:tyrosine-type recombinase/integrase [Burkholderia ubonensis]|uniref:tyrosine-type recombinase/integrase n=1 Tax=Burkholderia ubonensis TaxID=101571 RepID=UPI0021AA81E8|nr:tyrosine-type recombinase/integrase [Burkholderia ubonensis]
MPLIAETACRPGEATDADWDELDCTDVVWRRSAAKMKARRDHISPLSMQALAALKDLLRITGGRRYLFPHRSGKGVATPNRLTYAMRDMNLGRGTTPALLAYHVLDVGQRKRIPARCDRAATGAHGKQQGPSSR